MSLNSLTNLSNSTDLFERILEFEKRYIESYLYLSFLDTPQENGYYFLQRIQDKECKNPFLIFNNHKWDNLRVGIDTSVSIECKWPEIKLFNHKNNVYSFTRFPQRQWKRGIASSNTFIKKVVDTLFGIGDSNYFHTEELNSTLKPFEVTNIQDAVYWNKIFPNSCGIAFNSNFALFKSPITKEEENYLLVRNSNPCALVYPELKLIEVKYEYLEQEIIDLIKQEGSQWTTIFQQ